MTLALVAKKAACSESMISKIENGRALPSLAMLQGIAIALEISMSDLLNE